MDIKKMRKFNASMGKRQKMSKGGLIRKIAGRAYYDAGGAALTGPTNLVQQNAVNPNTGITGTIGGLLGTNDQFQAGSASINPGTNTAQLNTSYNQAQEGINNQQQLAQTLTPQAATAAENQNALAAQELALSQGQGPNPALAQLAQTTNTNVNNQAALMAGQRGGASNVGQIAREAAQQGATTQQQAAGQAATQEANQQIAAEQNLAALSGQQVGQTGQAVTGVNTAVQNEQNILQGANTAANNAAVNMQSNINQVNAQTAQANQQNNQGILGGIGSAVSSLTGGLLNEGGEVGIDGDMKPEHIKIAEMNAHSLKHGRKNFDAGGAAWGGQYTAPGAPQLAPPVPAVAAPAAAPIKQQTGYQQLGSMLGSGLRSVFSSTPKPPLPASGPGSQEDIDSGGLFTLQSQDDEAKESGLGPALFGKSDSSSSDSSTASADQAQPQAGGPGVYAPVEGDPFAGVGPNYQVGQANPDFKAKGGNICSGPHKSHVANFLADGGKVPAMVSPGERYLNPEEVKKVIEEGANPLKLGKKILGKPKVKGDSLKNDVVPMDLDEGGVVLPNHITHKPKRDKAELFVRRAVHMKNPKKVK